jgi:hypothetical protein
VHWPKFLWVWANALCGDTDRLPQGRAYSNFKQTNLIERLSSINFGLPSGDYATFGNCEHLDKEILHQAIYSFPPPPLGSPPMYSVLLGPSMHLCFKILLFRTKRRLKDPSHRCYVLHWRRFVRSRHDSCISPSNARLDQKYWDR